MFERLYSQSFPRSVHAKHFFAKKLESYAYHMLDSGYCRSRVKDHLRLWEHFLRWIRFRKLKFSDVSETCVEDFICYSYRKRKRKTSPYFERNFRNMLSKLLCNLRNDKLIPMPVVTEMWYTDELQKYGQFLEKYSGITKATIKQKQREVLLFFNHLGIVSWDKLAHKITAVNIDSYLKKRYESLTGRTRSFIAGNLRSILRYWYITKRLPEDLSFLVPTIRSYSLSSVPNFISWDDVQRLLSVFNRETKSGKRNYLIILILSTYGWRLGELANLTLDNINWRNECITILHGKTKKMDTYPLLPEVGDAIIDYLKNARPQTTCRNLLMKMGPPIGPFKTSTGIGDVVRLAFHITGIKPLTLRLGGHVLRHSRAVNMIDHGVSFKAVGDILGHSVPDSTLVYTKVDLKRLKCATLETIGTYNEK